MIFTEFQLRWHFWYQKLVPESGIGFWYQLQSEAKFLVPDSNMADDTDEIGAVCVMAVIVRPIKQRENRKWLHYVVFFFCHARSPLHPIYSHLCSIFRYAHNHTTGLSELHVTKVITLKVQHFNDNLVINIIIDFRQTQHILLP